MIAGRLSKARTCVTLTGNAIKKHVELPPTADEDEVEQRPKAAHKRKPGTSWTIWWGFRNFWLFTRFSSHRLIPAAPRDDVSHASKGIYDITDKPWNKVDMNVRNCLAGG